MATFRDRNLVGTYLSENFNSADTPLSVIYGRWTPPRSAFTRIGYTCGGLSTSTGDELDAIQKLTFTTDTSSTSSATLSQVRRNLCGLENGGVAGYMIGGKKSNGSLTNMMEKLLYLTETRTILRAILPDNQGSGNRTAQWIAACGNANVAGYMGGGQDDSGNARNVLDKFYFSTDTAIRLTNVLSVARNALSASKNTRVAGYFMGGYESNFSVVVDKFSFSAETVSTLGTGLADARNLTATCDNGSAAGYVMAGNGASTARTEKLSYVTDTLSVLSSSDFSANHGLALGGLTNNSVSGYAHGGNVGQTAYSKMPFATETVGLLAATSAYGGYHWATFSSGH